MIHENIGVMGQASAAEVHTPAVNVPSTQPSRHALPDTPVVLNDSQAASTAFNIRDIYSYRELLYFLAWRDIKVRYKQTAMGAAWAIIQPLFIMIVFAVFFGVFIGMPTEGMPYTLFFYCAIVPWTFFSGSLTTSSNSLIGNSNLITKIYFPRVIVPIATVGAGLVDLLITVVILVGMMFAYRVGFSWRILMMPAMLLLTVLFSMAIGVWLSALTVKYRDIRHALPFILQMWMYLTPIIYPLSVLSPKWQKLMYINPLTGITEGIRAAAMGKEFNWPAIECSLVITVLTFALAVSAFRRIEKSFADLI
ncbi:MAG: ABC transporter permease [Pyrinomonadaceae bacterium]